MKIFKVAAFLLFVLISFPMQLACAADEKTAAAVTSAAEKDLLPFSRLQKYRPKPLDMTRKNVSMLDKPLQDAKIERQTWPSVAECQSAVVAHTQEMKTPPGEKTPYMENRLETLRRLEYMAYPCEVDGGSGHTTFHTSQLLDLEEDGYFERRVPLTKNNIHINVHITAPRSQQDMEKLISLNGSRRDARRLRVVSQKSLDKASQTDQNLEVRVDSVNNSVDKMGLPAYSAAAALTAPKTSIESPTKHMASQVITLAGLATTVVSKNPKIRVAGALTVAAAQAMQGNCVIS